MKDASSSCCTKQAPGEESSPLLSPSCIESSSSRIILVQDDDDDDTPISHSIFRHFDGRPQNNSLWRDELGQLVKLALPVIGTYLLELLPGPVGIILVGHYSNDLTEQDLGHLNDDGTVENDVNNSSNYMDAAALGMMWFSMTGLAIGIGLASAMDTLCSQAHGAKEGHKMGTYLQTGLLVLGVAFAGVALVSWYATECLVALGQPLVLSQLAGQFTRLLLPGLPFVYGYELLRKVLQAQSIATPMLHVAIASNVLHIALGYYLVYFTSWGWLGAAVARTVCNMSLLLFLLIYIWYSKRTVSRNQSNTCNRTQQRTQNHSQSYQTIIQTTTPTKATNNNERKEMLVWTTGWNWSEAWGGVGEFLSLGIPGMLQLCFEWWTFEVLAILCGRFDNAVVAIGANAILLQICSMVYMLYLGISVSANVRIGNALGDGQPHRANLVANLSMGLGTCGSILCAAALWMGRTHLPYLFTNDVEIAALTSKLLRVGAAFQMADACQAAINGIFRGSGRQTLGATLNFVAYYVIGLPLGTLLAFYFHYNVQGLWIGLTVSLYFISFVGMVVVSKSDWVQLSKDAKARTTHYNARSTNTTAKQHVPILGSP